MASFQKIVLYSAIFVLIVTLAFIGLSLNRVTKQTWPPMTPECPDYWTADGSGNCINNQDLGTCPARNGKSHLSMNFNAAPYNTACGKYQWATNCGISWDGITYGVANPCQQH